MNQVFYIKVTWQDCQAYEQYIIVAQGFNEALDRMERELDKPISEAKLLIVPVKTNTDTSHVMHIGTGGY